MANVENTVRYIGAILSVVVMLFIAYVGVTLYEPITRSIFGRATPFHYAVLGFISMTAAIFIYLLLQKWAS